MADRDELRRGDVSDVRPLTAEQVAECHDDPFLWHIQDFDAVDAYVRAVEAERDALRERVERLGTALLRYGQHQYADCGERYEGAPCVCGLNVALAGISGAYPVTGEENPATDDEAQ